MIQIEGKVTEVCEELLCFKIKNTTTVHLLLYFIENGTLQLPAIGSVFKITSPCVNSNEGDVSSLVIVPNESKIEGDLWFVTKENNFLNVMRTVKPSLEDVSQFAKNYDDFCKYFKCGREKDQIFQSFMCKLNGRLIFTMSFPKQLKFVENDRECYKNLTFYTFGVNRGHVNVIRENYLFGFLYISKENGSAYLTDFNSHIPCIIIKEWDTYECYVYIKEYIVINEVYNGPNFFSTQYLLIESSNINIIEKKQENLPTVDYLMANEYKKETCKILKKSLFMATAAGTSQFWIQIYQNSKNKCFLLLDSSYSTIYSSLKPDRYYDLYYKSIPTGTFDREFTAVDPSFPLRKLSPQSFFIPTDIPQEQTKILTGSEACQALHTSNTVSFEATIVLKKFVESNSSRTQRFTNNPNFGTPSLKTHLLEFATDSQPLTLYLNNWENISVPYGLIPNMRVIVYNVKPHNGKYFKSTPLTSFQVVKYKPQVPFESANLCRFDWGLPYFLGAGKNIPRDTIVWTRLLSFFILGLKIYVSQEGELNPTITLICLDAMGESKVIAKSKDSLPLLKLLLGLQEPVFKKWCQSFISKIKSYKYFKGINLMEMSDTGMVGTITRSLTRYFKNIENYVSNLELMCRKIDTEPSGKAVYYFIDGRRS